MTNKMQFETIRKGTALENGAKIDEVSGCLCVGRLVLPRLDLDRLRHETVVVLYERRRWRLRGWTNAAESGNAVVLEGAAFVRGG